MYFLSYFIFQKQHFQFVILEFLTSDSTDLTLNPSAHTYEYQNEKWPNMIPKSLSQVGWKAQPVWGTISTA